MDLSLPDCYLITPEPGGDERSPDAKTAHGMPIRDNAGAGADIRFLADASADAQAAFLARLSDALSRGGVRLVQLRAKQATPAAYATLASQALALCRRHDARLILNGPLSARIPLASTTDHPLDTGLNTVLSTEPGADIGIDLDIDADGIHLSSAALMACRTRPLPAGKLVSAACHSVEQLMHAQHIGVDLLTLSPVLATLSHPDATPLGWRQFADMIDRTRSTPAPAATPSAIASGCKRPAIYALGGMTREHMTQAQACGAHGIAAIRALW